MGKGVKILSVILSLLLIASQACAKDGKKKIGYVDLYKVFNEYYKTKNSEKALEKKAEKKNKERDKMAEGIRKLREEAELLNKKEKEKKEIELEEKIKELRDFDRATREELNRERDSEGRDIIMEIGKAIAEYGKKNGYDLILDSRNLFYGGEDIDISDFIVRELNSKK